MTKTIPDAIKEEMFKKDDLSKSGIAIARELARQYSFPEKTICNYILAKRKGFDSPREYGNHILLKQGFSSQGEYVRYREYLAKNGPNISLEDYRALNLEVARGGKKPKKLSDEEKEIVKIMRENVSETYISELEQKVREMDDSQITLNNSAKIISEKLCISRNTARSYLMAFRKEFYSFKEYSLFLEWKQGNKDKTLYEANRRKENKSIRRKSVEVELIGLNYWNVVDEPISHLTEQNKGEIWQIVNKILKPNQAYILEERFLHCKTLQEVGDENSVTRERIRQIEEKAISRLRHSEHIEKLREFLYKPEEKII
jgi:hypothetical protein